MKKLFQNKRFLEDLLYFVGVLALASIVLTALLAVRPDMTFEQREVGKHTSLMLSLVGVQNTFYEYTVRVSVLNSNAKEIGLRLENLGFEKTYWQGGTSYKKDKLHPDDEKIVDAYTNNLIANGHIVYVVKSLIGIDGRNFEAEIVPECVGWLGFFAVVSLILAYPKIAWRKRVTGILIALPLMYAMNIARLTTSIYSAFVGGVAFFDFTHDFLWKTSLVAWALILWLFWIHYIAEKPILPLRAENKKKKKK